ncbi:MAG: T9SS type A sorting domain-containing protein [Saprospiraceae bacterium]
MKDCKKPTPYCYNGIATVIMPSNGQVIVWAKDLDAGSYDNCTRKADLKFSFDAEGKQASDTFTCADVPNGISSTNEVNIYVTDASGNVDHCRTYLLIQDGSGNICPDNAAATADIAGKVMTETTEPIENVTLNVQAKQPMPLYNTDVNGTYAFKNLPLNLEYILTPKRDDDPMNGVSTIDLVQIQKHILGTEALNSPYKIIAADVNKDNDVSAVDLVELRKLILTIYDKLPDNTSWRFVPKSFTFSNSNSPWGFPEKMDISNLSKNELNRDFVGVKIGDVNGTVVPHSLLGAEARTGGTPLIFNTIDRSLKAGEEAVIEFTSANFNSIEGYQFSLAMKGLDLKSVQSGILKVSEANFGMSKLGMGYLTTSWNEGHGITAGSNDVLFSITVKATKATTLSESLVINSKYTRAEAYGNNLESGVSLGFGKTIDAGYTLYQNSPNPFKGTTVISYELAKAADVTLKITDVTGRLVKSYSHAPGNKGYNQLKVNKTDISGAGVMYYTIETKDFTATKKMVIVE